MAWHVGFVFCAFLHLNFSPMKTKTKSELIASMAERFPHLLLRDVDFAVNGLLEAMGAAIAEGQRIEIRRFGSFTTHVRNARVGRNPRSGETVFVPEKRVLHFKPGKELRYRVDVKVKKRLDLKQQLEPKEPPKPGLPKNS